MGVKRGKSGGNPDKTTLGGVNALKSGKIRVWLVWAYLTKKVPHAETTPIATAFKTCISHRKNGLLKRLPEKVGFWFLTRFLYREVTSPQPAWDQKTRSGGKAFLFCAKVALGHFGST
jgi:hypothetical protein